jgi:aspartate/methionine/tyrosine aminotransferase
LLKIVKSIANLGTESAFEVLARAQQLSRQGKDIINLGIGQPDFQTPSNIVEAGVKALKDGHHGYTPANGIPELREAVACDLKNRYRADIDAENIVVVPGGKPTMFFSILMFGGPNSEIIYPDPGFPIYKSLIDFTGSKAIPISIKEENNFSFKADDILEKITSNTRLIIINSPANPTGGVTSKLELDKFVSQISKYPSIAILSDEIYSHMTYGNLGHISLLQYPEIKDQLIMLDGWSKTFAMTGWRIGFAVWPKKLIPYVTRLCINSHSCVNAASQYAGIEALTGPYHEVQNMLKEFDIRRQMICSELNSLPQINCMLPGGAFYVFPNIKGTGLSSEEAQNLFLNEAGVATIAGTSFGKSGQGYLRFSYANSREKIIEAIGRIKKLL